MAISSSLGALFRSRAVLGDTAQTFGTVHGQNRQNEMSERALPSKSRYKLWNSETSQLPRSFLVLVHIYSDKTPTSFRTVELVAYPAHELYSTAAERERVSLIE